MNLQSTRFRPRLNHFRFTSVRGHLESGFWEVSSQTR